MIAFDVEQMYQTSQAITETNHAIQANMRKIEQFVHSIEGTWQGEAEVIFEKKILDVKEQFTPICRFFEEYAEQLLEHTQIYEEHEQDIRTKLILV